MQHDARIQTVIEILEDCIGGDRSLDFLIQQNFRKRRYMGSSDRREVKGCIYKIIRSWGEVCFRLGYDPTCTENVPVRLITALSLYLNNTENVNALFSGRSPYGPQALGADECAAVDQALSVKAIPEWAQYNIPEWVWEVFQGIYGAEAVDVASTLNQPAGLTVRVLSGRREAFLDLCAHQSLQAEPTPLAQSGVRFMENVPVGKIPFYQEGHVIIQDEGSQLMTDLTYVGKGMGWDVCAGGGGKTIGLMERLAPDGEILATDIDLGRLKQAFNRIKMEAPPVQFKVLSPIWLETDTPDDLPENIQWSLIDAPCSGIGAWRRSPFARWCLQPEQIDHMQERQIALLAKVAQHICTGGYISYVTCSILPAENDDVINKFLLTHPHFICTYVPSLSQVPGHEPKGGTLTLHPHISHTDGFFIAVLQRVG